MKISMRRSHTWESASRSPLSWLKANAGVRGGGGDDPLALSGDPTSLTAKPNSFRRSLRSGPGKVSGGDTLVEVSIPQQLWPGFEVGIQMPIVSLRRSKQLTGSDQIPE